MIKVNCPNCGVRLTAADELIGRAVTCQKCATNFILSKRWTNQPLDGFSSVEGVVPGISEAGRMATRSANRSADESAKGSLEHFAGPFPAEKVRSGLSFPQATVPGRSSPQPFASRDGSGTEMESPAAEALPLDIAASENHAQLNGARSRALRRPDFNLDDWIESRSLLDIFDYRFQRYLTPRILRISWIVILSAAALVLLWMTAMFCWSFVPSRWTEMDDPALITSANPERFQLRPQVAAFALQILTKTALFGLAVSGVFLALLWLRVVCECVCLLFRSAGTLKTWQTQTLVEPEESQGLEELT